MSVPSWLASVAEIVEVCKWWKLGHTRFPYRYNGTKYTTQHECTNPTWCKYNTIDARLGGCIINGNVAKIPREERP